MGMEHNTSLTLQEQIEALADGELSADYMGSLLDAMEAEPATYEAWAVHHAVAASVRGERVDAPSGDLAFWQTLQKRLAQESDVPDLQNQIQVQSPVIVASSASNESFWKVRALASFAMVLAVGGLAAVLWPQGGPSEPFAQSGAPAAPVVTEVAAADGSVMLRNPELDALMAAHQQMGGHSAWQAPSGFLRNATFERSDR
ncbi:MAG: hypothetical protein EBR49_10405 [Betaproteobacteria bacterium]|nr:hypothetical protein [Betaproteobacteria bacterium]